MIPPLLFPVVNLYKQKDDISVENLFFFFFGGGGRPVMLLGLAIFALFFLVCLES